MMGAPRNIVQAVSAERCPDNPLITFASDPSLGRNINGPSLIRVPAWVERPLGRYYLYFAHHGGDRIRLAYSDDVRGPWKIHGPGTLRLEDAAAFEGHVASPDVHVDEENREIRMYFHGPARATEGQWTGVAFSSDGLEFRASRELLGKFYFRVFRHGGFYYAIAKDWNSGWGALYRSSDGRTRFESLRQIVRNVRHTALVVCGDHLLIFYSRKGDAPERILLSSVELGGDHREWSVSQPIDVLRPEEPYEGTAYRNRPSRYGAATKVRQLRDPCIFEEDGRTYLFYSVAGEMGIAMAELTIRFEDGALTERPGK